MKHTLILLSYACCLVWISAFAEAAIPERWDVDLAAQPPQVFTLQRPRGETYDLEAVLNVRGKPFAPAITNACIYWQTNGMENLYWSAPASVSNNVLRALWLPEMDPGATTVRGYIGDPGHIYAAAFQFRFIASPGPLPNVLPLPTPVIDFAKVTVLNPPWSGGGGGVNTNAVRDIAREEITPATNRLYKTLIDAKDGSARPLPKYLHLYNADDSYPDAAQEYYRQREEEVKVRGEGEQRNLTSTVHLGPSPSPKSFACSAVRDGGFLYRNFDYPFDDRAEFVVRTSASTKRFASVGVAQVGTNLTEAIVTSGKPSRCYKWLPGATVDGINEHGVVAEINVVDGEPDWHATGDLHPLGAVRCILDTATNAQQAATYIAANIRFPQGWAQNFHYMIADETATYIVENGTAFQVTNGVPAMTNFRLYGDPKDTTGEGQERYVALTNGANITSQWWTLTYTANGYRASDLPGITGESLTQLFNYWENNPRESHRGETFPSQPQPSTSTFTWWQSVHTSIYDITNRVLRVAVQEQDDWYVFQVPSSGAKIDTYTRAETDAMLAKKIERVDGIGPGQFVVFTDGGVMSSGISLKEETSDIDFPGDVTAQNLIAYGDVKDSSGNVLSEKANKNGDQDEGFAASYLLVGEVLASGDITSSADVKDTSGNVLSEKADRSMISATNSTFSSEVLKVQVASLSTNITAEVYIAATNACANLGIDPALIPGEGTIGTVGGFIAMLFVVVFWMRKKIFDNSGKVNDTFAGELLGKQVANVKVRYALATASSATMADRTVNILTMTQSETLTFPTATTHDNKTYARDFLLKLTYTSGTMELPQGVTKVGDELSFEAGKTYLIAFTEIAADKFYVRSIDITEAQA